MKTLESLQSGGPLPRHNLPTKTIAQRLWNKANEDETGCWIWTAALNTKGYGITTDVKHGPGRARKTYAHRLAWEVTNGPIPDGMVVDHTCYRRNCINPAHMRIVTSGQNNENRAGASRISRTGVRGVYPLSDGRFTVQAKHRHIGIFDSLPDAIRAARAARRALMPHSLADRVST